MIISTLAFRININLITKKIKMMRLSIVVLLMCSLLFITSCSQGKTEENKKNEFNRSPLIENHFAELPLGSIKPKGWLLEMLIRQKDGATGKLDVLYPEVMGKRNGWLGGDGDQWERGPYWIDGLLPLAYILEDSTLIAKAKTWVEWAIQSQREDGYFGPSQDYPQEKGLQRDNCEDWWPKMVVLKILQQYYSATEDQRVINLMTNYFKYQLNTLEEKPLDKWTFWARMRGGDNLMMVYWLYNITGDKELLKLGELIHKQTEDYTKMFLDRDKLTREGTIHSVNLAQGMKSPIVYYQADPQQKYLDALETALDDLQRFHGYPTGMFSGDEAIHGNDPTQGTELCTVVEFMFSLETMYKITGNARFADLLEKVTYNALPAHVDDKFLSRQYFQQVNQIELSQQQRNFDVNHAGLDNCFGLLTGYPCCTSNMHQGWPKFVQNLWYASHGGGIAATMYAPSEVKTKVGDNVAIHIIEDTRYPFEETIDFTIKSLEEETKFPFVVRIPSWSTKSVIMVNGQTIEYTADNNNLVSIDRIWKEGDKLSLEFTPEIRLSVWKERSHAVERGPLVYALKMDVDEKYIDDVHIDDAPDNSWFHQHTSQSPWNYALMEVPAEAMSTHYIVDNSNTAKVNEDNSYPWNDKNAPVTIKTKGRKMFNWKEYNKSAGPLPYTVMFGAEVSEKVEDIELIPYGCTTLRITQFPMTGYHSAE